MEQLFTDIINESNVMSGRFYIGYKYGLQEVNYDTLGEVLGSIPGTNKYPLAMMAPPHSTLNHAHDWETYRIIMFFVKPSLVESISRKTNTSDQRTQQDWDDMKKEAQYFMVRLENRQRAQTSLEFVLPNHVPLYIPISHIGADRVSGIRLDFDFKLFIGCLDLPM